MNEHTDPVHENNAPPPIPEELPTSESPVQPQQNSGVLDEVAELLSAARAEIARVVIGQEEVIGRCLIAILARQHILIEGVPGVAKTLLVRTLARVMGCEFNRIQFTPDLMPADITGTNVFNIQTNSFHFLPGPIFTTFLLADEINRAPAKTQSALLQAMQERVVSIDRESRILDPAFTVFATQNPVEHEGTYPLPEAQKDRFFMKITMDPPDREDELTLARRMIGGDAPERVLEREEISTLLAPESMAPLLGALDYVTVREELLSYIVDLVRQTRSQESVLVGAGPRATQGLLLASRGAALLAGRDFVTPDDVRAQLESVLGHRLVLRPEFEIEGVTVREVIDRIVEKVPVPR